MTTTPATEPTAGPTRGQALPAGDDREARTRPEPTHPRRRKGTTMLRVIRTSTWREINSQIVELHNRAECERGRAEELVAELDTRNSQIVEDATELLRKELNAAREALAYARGEHETLRAQHLLDTEDRVTLRMLLRTTRRQAHPLDRVYVLFQHGRLHSVHATRDAAEITAEAEGAPRSGWSSDAPGAALPPAADVLWRIQPLTLHTAPKAEPCAPSTSWP